MPIQPKQQAPYYKNKTPPGSYKEYTALITQTGTTAPTVKILNNTLGNIVWTRAGIGDYIGTLAGAFTADKTWINRQDLQGSGGHIPLAGATISEAWWEIYRGSINIINISTTLDNQTPVEWSDYPTEIGIEIRVYD